MILYRAVCLPHTMIRRIKYYRHNIIVTFCISVLSWSRRCIGFKFKSGLHTLCETKDV